MQSQVLISLLLGEKLNTGAIEFGLEGGINWTQISGLETKLYQYVLLRSFRKNYRDAKRIAMF